MQCPEGGRGECVNKIIKILLMADACFIFTTGLFVPIYAVYVAGIGGDLLDAGWAWAAFSLTLGIAIYLLSRWENKHKHYEQCIIGGYALRTLAIFGYLFVQNPIHLIIVQIFFGLGEAFTVPAFDTLFSKSVDPNKEAEEWGDWESMYYMITALSAVIGAGVATALGFHTLFIFMFGVSVIGLVLSIRLTPKAMLGMPVPAIFASGKRRKK